jgi:hypothetical protein
MNAECGMPAAAGKLHAECDWEMKRIGKPAISKSSSLIPTFLIQFDCGIAADTAAATEAGADGRNPR